MSTGGLGMKIRAANAFVTLGVQDNLSKGLSMAERKLKDFGQRTASMATKLAGASLAVAGPGLISAQAFAGFETTMARVRGLTNATKDEFTLLWQEAKRLGAETQYTARDAARGMAFYAQAGFKVTEIHAAMLPTLDLAAAGQLDVAESADILAKIMHGMGVPATDLSYHVDVLTKAMQTANTDLRQLGEAFKYAGAVSKTAGISFEETTAFLQMMSNAGIQADMAGTTLRGALLALTSPSKEAAEQLKALKIDTMDANGNFVSLADVVGQFETAMAGMGTGEKLEILGRIFDNRQASGFAEAVAQGGDALKKMTESLRDSSGAAARFRAIQMNTVAGQWELFTSAIETLQITLGEVTGKPIRSLLRGLTEIVSATLRFVEANQWVVIVLGAIGVLLATGAAYFLTLSLAAMSAQAAVQLFGFAVSAVKTIILGFHGAMYLLFQAAKFTQGAIMLLGYSMVILRGVIIAAEITLRIFQVAVVGVQYALKGLGVVLGIIKIGVLAASGALWTFLTTSLAVQNTLLVLGFVIKTLQGSIMLAASATWAWVVASTAADMVGIALLFLAAVYVEVEAVVLSARAAVISFMASSKILAGTMYLLQATVLTVGYALYSMKAAAIVTTIATYTMATVSWIAGFALRALSLSLYLVQGAMFAVNLAIRAVSISVMLLANPWVALIAVVTGVVLLVERYLVGWSVTLQDTSSQFGDMLLHIKWVMQGIYDAIVAGRIDLAFKIALAGAKLALSEGLLAITGMFGMGIEDTSNMIAELYKQFMQVVTKVNRWRAEASNWLAKQMGKVVGVDVQDGDSAALAAAAEWETAINNIDTSKLAKSISEALDPEEQMHALNELLGEAAQAADKAFQDPSTGPKLDPRAPGFTPSPDGIIGNGEAQKFASIGGFTASMLSRQLPGAKGKDAQIADNTKKTVVELQKIGATLGGMGGMVFAP